MQIGYPNYIFEADRFKNKQTRSQYADPHVFELLFVPYYDVNELQDNFSKFRTEKNKTKFMIVMPQMLEMFGTAANAYNIINGFDFRKSTYNQFVEYLDAKCAIQMPASQNIEEITNQLIQRIRLQDSNSENQKALADFCKKFNLVNQVPNEEYIGELKLFLMECASRTWTYANFKNLIGLFLLEQTTGNSMFKQKEELDLRNRAETLHI